MQNMKKKLPEKSFHERTRSFSAAPDAYLSISYIDASDAGPVRSSLSGVLGLAGFSRFELKRDKISTVVAFVSSRIRKPA